MSMVYPTPDLADLAELWAEAERRYPPTAGWGLKIFRRWLSEPHDGAVWGVSFTRTKGGDRLTHVSADAGSPTEAFRILLDPAREATRHEASVRFVEQLVDEAEQVAKERRDQLVRVKASA